MKVALTIWNNRISPVFDVAQHVLLLEAQQSVIQQQQVVDLPVDSAINKLTFLVSQKVDLLICGAISRSLQLAIEEQGINVYPFCSGEVSELIECWQKDQLERVSFAMPGCGKRRRIRQRTQGNGCRNSDNHCRRQIKHLGGNDA
ncbi:MULTISPECIES: NifB/NifX family molybdenum-iron cluster-binding protein [Vibrio]|nr:MULTISPECIES: NifB/NifX family molybdenum-iron cluster-binding protein [Vibrio]NAW69726.1 hypothetical protein [Vibrio sp. V28_P6S34P95]NAX06291.1 hypothetical protein [Vibrio sp. V30_P3S12P165]NAX34890.1 hypothetical protein [Vibrio sp. V29_P1S30P107]NAX37908.1 hypothetical protein [Vibrio sp. V27_P1S3P104]